jgi:hypothetical protein
MILKPGTPTETPAVIFKGQTQGQEQTVPSLDFGEVAPGRHSLTIKIENPSKEPLIEPQVVWSTTLPEGQDAFGIENNQLAGLQTLASGDSKSVDVVLVAQPNVSYAGKLTVRGKNLPTEQTIALSGKWRA